MTNPAPRSRRKTPIKVVVVRREFEGELTPERREAWGARIRPLALRLYAIATTESNERG